MSCIQLPAAHIAALIRFALDCPTRPFTGRSQVRYYSAESKTWEPITEETAPIVAAILAQANANAYAERYRETPAPVNVYTTRPRRVRTLTPVETIKACHGYGYQTSDWSGYDNSTAENIINVIVRAACECLTGYNDADSWVIADPPTTPAPVTLRYTRVQMDADNAEARLFAAIHD